MGIFDGAKRLEKELRDQQRANLERAKRDAQLDSSDAELRQRAIKRRADEDLERRAEKLRLRLRGAGNVDPRTGEVT